MIELLKLASAALIANDAVTLERLAQDASGYTGQLRAMSAAELAGGSGATVAVLRRQVSAASVQLALRKRLNPASSLQAHPWER